MPQAYLPRLGSPTTEALAMLLSWVANRPDAAGQDVPATASESGGETRSATA
ncbi:hypothetical protein [Phytohabitans rumicis]|uniref:hypothetical protein n=1 Tax=Phytohabitans rumicis TaxID=1076125 RepID=UPI001C49AD3B|nr:hypothetical protein [Phytohabitans rumicis]